MAAKWIDVVEDHAAVRRSILLLLQAKSYDARGFASANDYLAAPEMASTQCLIVDHGLPDITGVELIAQLRSRGYDTPAIVVSGNGSDELLRQLATLPKTVFLQKPWRPAELFARLESLCSDTHHPNA